ncbi:MAG TPA: prepilin-type N-terminal cleavage/methylation domain-containing protein [Gemmatimonadaceae bacterium]
MRRGFSLVEMLIAISIAGVATALMTVTVLHQQRFYARAGETLSTKTELRDGADILVSDLRSASTAMFGLPVMTDTAVEMLSVIATSVACETPAGSTIQLPPVRLAAGHTLTSLVAQPDTGDVALIYGNALGADSAEWEINRVASFAPRSVTATCSPSTGFTTTDDLVSGSSGYLVTLAFTPSSRIGKGAPVHFLRRARYSIYKSSDGDWYLGYRRCSIASPGTCSAIQPVSGPYRPVGSTTPHGLSFRYFDSYGAQLYDASQSTRVARVEIVLRGAPRSLTSSFGDSRQIRNDSVIISVALRNSR